MKKLLLLSVLLIGCAPNREAEYAYKNGCVDGVKVLLSQVLKMKVVDDGWIKEGCTNVYNTNHKK